MKKNITLLIAAIVGTICSVVLLITIKNIGTMPVIISIILSIAATVFAWIGWGLNKNAFAIVSGVGYLVAIALMPSVGIIVLNIVQMILCFISYGLMRKNNNG